MKGLSLAADALVGQPMFQMIDRARELEDAGRSIVHLEIGEPDFETPEHISAEAVTAIQKGDTHYVSSWGIVELRRAVQDATENSRGFRPDLDQVLVTPGANIATYIAIRCLVDPGFEVLIPDPGFPTYQASVVAAGVKGIPYQLSEENSFRISADLIESQITDRTRLIVLNSPSNPTGAVTPPEEIRRVYELAEKHDLYIFSDEIYARMIFDSVAFSSPGSLDLCRERVIISNGFSKAFAMTGWRLGVMIGPAAVMAKMMLFLQTTLSCVPPFVQRAGIAAITGGQGQVNNMMQAYQRRRDLVVSGVRDCRGLSTPTPGGAFYLFPSIERTGLSSDEFGRRLLEEAGVAVVPGGHFGPSGEGHVRLSFASNEDLLAEGIRRLREFCEKL